MGVVVYSGSVKAIETLELPRDERFGIADMVFSDDYSVFDYGRMPDEIKEKGAALCMMSSYLFERIGNAASTHYLGVVNGEGEPAKTADLRSPSSRMRILLANKHVPKRMENAYDYSVFNSSLKGFLIPLEFIYRNSLPAGSSVFRRLKTGELSLEELGLDHFPAEGEKLPFPFLDLSTKLEAFDDYISWHEGKKRAGLAGYEVEDIRQKTLLINDIITREFNAAGMCNEDGKLEFVMSPSRILYLADAVGTLDECRITYRGIQFSKEAVRQFYRKEQPDWVWQIEAAKKTRNPDWKELVSIQPIKLPETLKQIVSHMYTSSANALLGRKLFDAPSLDEVAAEYIAWRAA